VLIQARLKEWKVIGCRHMRTLRTLGVRRIRLDI
jgi:hypothetical protein